VPAPAREAFLKPAAIRLEGLSKVYDAPSRSAAAPQVVAAADLNLEVPAGEVFGLVGSNGAGKTTTLKMICGLLVPTAGRITVHGTDVERDPETAQGMIGYLADFFSLYDDLKVWEYLDYFAHAYKMAPATISGRIAYAVQRTGLDAKRDAFIAGLSRGMKQRLGIARAILHDPPVLVLDEPAVGLDPKGRTEFKDLVGELRRLRKTVFITSHLLADLEEMCSFIAVIEQGRLLRVGRLAEILRGGAGLRVLRVKLAPPGFPLAQWLSARRGVSGVAADAEGARFSLTGGELEMAALVQALVAAGAPVYAVGEVADTLETVVSRLASGEGAS